ncbi:hypothetical protein WBJ53_29985 [Spirosoma sp. SC4-14]|uniref:hypothetical protein n=1 Tax=Spirosoma sp. SC4-14 TaxID=3128900 RepID=UPI0030CCE2B0
MTINLNPILIRVRPLNEEVKYFIVAFCILFADLKIFEIKVSELLMFLFFVLYINKYFNKISTLLYFFSLFLIFSLLITSLLKIGPLSSIYSFLKMPYIISLSRYVEYLSCIGFSLFSYHILFKKKYIYIYKILDYTLLFAIIFIIEFVLIYLGFYSISESLFYYGTYRLRGFYVEGGPLGLCYAFIMSLVYLFGGKYKLLKIFILFIVIILSQSKAGILYILLFAIFILYEKVKIPKFYKPIAIIIFTFTFMYIVSIVVQGYLYEIANVSTNLQYKQNDTNYVMGRIAGLFIIPNIVKSNYLFGIGMGNYPLVRNFPAYRGIFPEVELWDSSGLGGFIDLLVDGGLFFGCIFIYVIKNIYIRSAIQHKKYLLLAFALPFALGLQLYFLYPWFIIGIFLNGKSD